MSELRIGTWSDDVIDYSFEEEGDELGTAQATFTIELPTGHRLPITVDYDSGWQFKVTLPEGSTLISVVDELEDDEYEEGEDEDDEDEDAEDEEYDDS